MDIPPFYEFLIGFSDKERTRYAFLTSEKRLIPVEIEMTFPSYNRVSKRIYGVRNKNGEDVIGEIKLFSEQNDFKPLFSLSQQRIFHTTVSEDGQKIAFLTQDKTGQDILLRVVAKEEFGWFPLPFIRMKASLSGLCFCSADVLMYADEKENLCAVRLKKPVKTVPLALNGRYPAFDQKTQKTAFIQNKNLIVFNEISYKLKSENHISPAFSKSAGTLFFTDWNGLYSYDPETKEVRTVFTAPSEIVFFAEL